MKIRINTDAKFRWKLLIEGEEVDLEYYDIIVEITKPSHTKEIIDMTIDGSTLLFSYKPNQVGQYIATAYLNRYKPDEAALDVKIFEGVRWSWNADNDNGENDNLTATTVELEGNISYGSVNLNNYYTKQEIDEKLEDIAVGDVDLTGYATEQWVEDKGYLTEVPSEFVTESELETRLEGVGGSVDLTGYATEQWVEDKGYLTEVPSEFVTESELETRLEGVGGSVDLTGYATEQWVEDKGYVTNEDLADKGYLTSIPAEYVTESELADKDYVTNEYLKSKQYITQADLAFGDFNLDGYYSKFEADEIFVQKGEVNMDDYATIYQVQMKQDKLVSGTNIKTVNGESIVGEGNISFDEFANKQEVLVSGVNIKTINGQSILGEGDIMITGGDTPDMTGYVTTVELNNKGFITSIPDEYITEGELNDRNYATVASVEAKQNVLVAGQNIKTINGKSILGGGNLVISGGSGEVDLTGYATEQWVNNKGYLTSVPAEYVTETELIDKGYLTSVPAEYVTETELNDKGYLTSVPAEYVTETELNDKGYLTSVPAEYVTETELNDKGYLTSIPSEYITESELEARLEGIGSGSVDLTGYATEQWVEDKGYITSTDLDKYVTEDELADKGYITSIPSNYVTGVGVTNIRKMTQADYDAITPYANTLYIIVG